MADKAPWLTKEDTQHLARLMKTNPRAARMELARKAAAQVKPEDEAWQHAFALNIEADRCLNEARKSQV